MLTFLKRPRNIILILLAVFIIFGFFMFRRGGQTSLYEFVAAKKGTISQEVSITGRVEAAENVELAFEKNGKVAVVYVTVGDKVVTGQILASLNNAEIEAQLAQAQATLLKEQTTLAQLKTGTRAEEIQIARTTVSNAEKEMTDEQNNLNIVTNKAAIDLDNLYSDIKDILNDAYAKADDAVNKQAIGIFNNGNSANPQLTFSSGSQAEVNAESKRVLAGTELVRFKSGLDNLPTDQAGLDNALINAGSYLTNILDFLNSTGEALDNSAGLLESDLTSYKYNINLGRTNVNTALTSVTTQKQSIATQKSTNQSNINTAQTSLNTAENTLASARDNLALKLAGSTPEQIAAQEAQVKYASANVQNYLAQLGKGIIRSPFNGIVTKQNAKLGEIITANNPEISVLSEAKFEIEANVPEADIAKIKLDNSANVTLDAYGNSVIFEAKIVQIEPAETMVEGVATYKTTLQFNKDDERIKSGMTANIDILAARKNDVLLIPQRAVRQKNNHQYVLLKTSQDDAVEERAITAGLKGSDGNIEIISGLNEGDEVVNVEKK